MFKFRQNMLVLSALGNVLLGLLGPEYVNESEINPNTCSKQFKSNSVKMELENVVEIVIIGYKGRFENFIKRENDRMIFKSMPMLVNQEKGSYCRQRNRITIELYQEYTDRDGSVIVQYAVLSHLRDEVIKNAHGSVYGAYQRRDKDTTMSTIRDYWPKVNETSAHAHSCDVCQRTKSPNQYNNPEFQPIRRPISTRVRVIAIDLNRKLTLMETNEELVEFLNIHFVSCYLCEEEMRRANSKIAAIKQLDIEHVAYAEEAQLRKEGIKEAALNWIFGVLLEFVMVWLWRKISRRIKYSIKSGQANQSRKMNNIQYIIKSSKVKIKMFGIQLSPHDKTLHVMPFRKKEEEWLFMQNYRWRRLK